MCGVSERRRQGGFGLLEVVVAAAIFSLGLGSMSLLLLLAVQGTLAPRSATFAALHARSFVEAMRLVPDGATAAGPAPASCTPAAACSPAEMAASITESWLAQVERDLPTGRGLVCRDSALDDACPGDGTVAVTWRTTDPDSGAETGYTFALALPLP